MESQTLSSSLDETGHRYWVSFSNSSFAKGSTSHAHKGFLNGMGPRSGEKAIVKAFRNEPGTQSRCDTEIAKSEKAEELAKLFNRKFSENNLNIAFAEPLKALMDRIALIDVFSFSRRRLNGREWVLIEQNMGKRFQVFVKRHGEVSRTIHPLLPAFMHFSYHHTGGDLLVCGLKGAADEVGWTLKIPTIHSVKQEYGLSDCGESGIMQVFSRHECNYICEGMQLPNLAQRMTVGELSPRLEHNRSSPIPMFQRQPSAPFDPEVFCDPLSPMMQGYLPSPPPYFQQPFANMGQTLFYLSDPGTFGSCDDETFFKK
ncbi:uncharacterized protein LOC124138545 [Haliotis rufescens]|uniref:uncharacterized protein LOC124138545 n=1 Tax=Haliotis rufescens TaxID=6454 RepID=UPI00201F57CC|nr:uncharacterized protein LOC124138545 [Haliotis rufescens]XP_046361205.2 uncharacterized protein LOC124138545 [Haliotis rufescens]